MRATRLAARAIGWLFVGVIGYHAVLAVIEAERAADHRNWAHATELLAIAIASTAIVTIAVVGVTRSSSRAR